MSTNDRVWTLHRCDDGELLADFVVTGGDFPWLHGRVRAYEGLAGVRPLFAEELRYPDGREVPEFLLHVDGEDAWWRWSDEPFDPEHLEDPEMPEHPEAQPRHSG